MTLPCRVTAIYFPATTSASSAEKWVFASTTGTLFMVASVK